MRMLCAVLCPRLPCGAALVKLLPNSPSYLPASMMWRNAPQVIGRPNPRLFRNILSARAESAAVLAWLYAYWHSWGRSLSRGQDRIPITTIRIMTTIMKAVHCQSQPTLTSLTHLLNGCNILWRCPHHPTRRKLPQPIIGPNRDCLPLSLLDQSPQPHHGQSMAHNAQ